MMPLVKCPDCGKLVSDLAKACIGCGRPLNTIPDTQFLPVQTKPEAKQSNAQRTASHSDSQEIKRHTKKNIFIILFWVLVLCYGLYGLLDTYNFLSVSEPAEAIVLSSSFYRYSEGKTAYTISYMFNVNGYDYSGTDSVGTPPSSKYITILYNRNNPDENKAHEPSKTMGWVLIGIAIFSIAIFSGVLKRFRD